MTTTEIARHLRRHQTGVEQLLWQRLRNRGAGWKVKRQVPVLGYIADFFIHEIGLVIELDGSQHAEEQAEYDQRRTTELEAEGYSVLRFWNYEVNDDIENVVERICWKAEHLKQSRFPSPEAAKPASTSPQGEVVSDKTPSLSLGRGRNL